jgi:(+)-trans-carveol dehydrogenase
LPAACASSPVPPALWEGAHAVGLAREGCDLVLCDILQDLPDGAPYPKATTIDLDKTVRLVEAEGRRCIAQKSDVRDPA